MENKKNNVVENKNNSYWTYIGIAVLLFIVVVAVLIFSQKEDESKEGKIFNHNQQGWYNNNNGWDKNNPSSDRNREDKWNKGKDKPKQKKPDTNQDFREKGYSERDIKQLKDWGFEASDVPDLKAKKRRGVVNTLAVGRKTEKGSCSQLVIIKKESPHVSSKEPQWTKIKQSSHFADTSGVNETVIRFAIAKIIEQGYNWKYDVYVLQANDNAVISGSSAGSSIYIAFLSACYSDCAIPKSLAITGELKVEKKEIPNEIRRIPKKYQWRTNLCSQCGNYSDVWHLIYDKETGKLEKHYTTNATDPNSQWVFCNQQCYNEWWDKNVYNCLECGRQRFGNCSCCSKYHSWVGENDDGKLFCSKKCINKHYPKTYEEGKVAGIGGIRGKVTAAVEKGCDIIVISKENSSDYYNEVPLSIRAKIKKIYEVENYEELKNLFPF
ncbi:MAG: hypothetical protein I3273_07235 [Candidatus Moeniiplasma glomeromycotorum]|nr:hypothetical protein [Candidatus Moeniiplasma glomeromycotorum]MCE8169879.1 hypothetical protein [Candidatus Moeniiplasma glomeromycotorum]